MKLEEGDSGSRMVKEANVTGMSKTHVLTIPYRFLGWWAVQGLNL